MNVTRQEFLRRVLAPVRIGLLYAKKRPKFKPLHDADALPRRLASLFTHKESAAIIGVEYLRRVPTEPDIGSLPESICPGSARCGHLALDDDGRLR
ncbi:MAG: hypothetical protein O7E52_26915 [Candidatus Poribacteria bacterium]|nr:hypothetical protein [Candidatus Poribacteria bacterium]MCZ6719602.1 hypothetical protein [Gammaproteobacteria bacterium]